METADICLKSVVLRNSCVCKMSIKIVSISQGFPFIRNYYNMKKSTVYIFKF